jgi:hypothetical protein
VVHYILSTENYFKGATVIWGETYAKIDILQYDFSDWQLTVSWHVTCIHKTHKQWRHSCLFLCWFNILRAWW